jgi:hypothetical protein
VIPDSNIPPSARAARRLEALSPAEGKLFSELLAGAVGRNGVVRLNHFPAAPGKSAQWPYWLLENRDLSRLAELTAATLTTIEESVIDRAECRVRNRAGRTTAIHRTASAHAIDTDGEPRMLALECREETAELDETSLGPVVLEDYLEVTKRNGLEVAAAPLYGLEPELATHAVRRRLLQLGIPYALLLDPHRPFLKVFSPPQESWDVVDWIAVEDLFDVHRPNRDKDRPDHLVVGDLEVGDSEQRPVAEIVVEIPADGIPLHFLIQPALPPPANKHERERQGARAVEMAERGAELLSQSPAAALRAHEFLNSEKDVYCNVLRIAQWGRLV